MFNLGSSYFHVALTTVRHLLTVALAVHLMYKTTLFADRSHYLAIIK